MGRIGASKQEREENDKKPVIAHLRRDFLPITETFIENQILGLENFDSVVLAREASGRFLSGSRGFKIFSKKSAGAKSLLKIASKKEEDFFIKKINESRACLLHAYFGADAWYFLNLKKRTNLPLIVSFYGYDAYSLPKKMFGAGKLILKKVFVVCDLVLVPSEQMKMQLVDLSCDERKIKVLPWGVDTERIVEKRKENPSTPFTKGETEEGVEIPLAPFTKGERKEEFRNIPTPFAKAVSLIFPPFGRGIKGDFKNIPNPFAKGETEEESDTSPLPSSQRRGKKIRFIHIGRMVEKKGQIYLLRAFKAVLEKGVDAQLTIIGTGRFKKKIMAAIDKLKISDRVKQVDNLPNEQVFDELTRHDIYVQPSVIAKNGDQEGIPTAIMEAMLCGLPVIATFHSGIPEIIENKVSGILVPERDSERLAEAMEFLAKNPEICQRFSENGRKAIKEKFNLKKQVKKIEEVYMEMIERS
ncbi:MAG: glycosyltransferase family 4 protein [bacterium]